MRLVVALYAVMAASPAFAEDYTKPEEVIAALYAPYMKPADQIVYSDLDNPSLRSERLNLLYQADEREAGDGIGRLDFDPYVNGQDFEITNLRIDEPYLAGGRAVVRVTFDNMATPQELGYLLIWEDHGWRIDDLWSDGPDFGYSLRDILEGGPE